MKIINSPSELAKCLYPKISQVSTPPISIEMWIWIHTANKVHDPDCQCANREQTLHDVEYKYSLMGGMPEPEKNKLLDFMGETCVVLLLNGKEVGRIEKTNPK